MSKVKEEVFNAILAEMRDTIIGGLVSSQIAKTSLSDIIEAGISTFDKYSKEDIIGAFIGFGMNVSVAELERQGNEVVVTTSESTPMSKGGEA